MSTPATTVDEAPARTAPAARGIPLTRLLRVELRKMFDTRSGFWLLVSIGIAAALATVVVIAAVPEEQIQYESFIGALGVPIGVLLPVIAVLSVTSEWSQRTGLVTFTLEPRRLRVVLAKAVVVLGTGVVAMALAVAVGALGNLAGSWLRGTDLVWDFGPVLMGQLLLGNVLGMMMGFMLGVLLRSSPAAIVAFFAWAFVLPPITMGLAGVQDWFADIQPWVDFGSGYFVLLGDQRATGEEWAQIATSGALWLVLPLALGLRNLTRTEIK